MTVHTFLEHLAKAADIPLGEVNNGDASNLQGSHNWPYELGRETYGGPVDCSGLVVAIARTENPDYPRHTTSSGFDAMATEPIGTLKKSDKAVLLWREGHMAIHTGNRNTIEARSEDLGTMRCGGDRLQAFERWGFLDFIDYSDTTNTEMEDTLMSTERIGPKMELDTFLSLLATACDIPLSQLNDGSTADLQGVNCWKFGSGANVGGPCDNMGFFAAIAKAGIGDYPSVIMPAEFEEWATEPISTLKKSDRSVLLWKRGRVAVHVGNRNSVECNAGVNTIRYGDVLRDFDRWGYFDFVHYPY